MTDTPPTTKDSPARKGFWERIEPAARTRRGIGLFSLLAALALGAYLGRSRLRTEWGELADIGIGMGIMLLFAALAPLLLWLVDFLVRRSLHTFGWLGLGAFFAMMFVLDETGLTLGFAALCSGGIVVGIGLVFGSLLAISGKGFADLGGLKKFATICCGMTGLVLVAALAGWAWTMDTTDHLLSTEVHAAEKDLKIEKIGAEDPGAKGNYQVEQLTYGSGTDKHRKEFGKDVGIRTEPVDGSEFVKFTTSWRGKLRKDFWGFDHKALPRNGRVWHPKGDGPFPLVLIVHGNHHMAEFSDTGYAWLGEHLASRGFICCSVDQNFLNGGGVLMAGLSKENDARGWLMLQHLALWREWATAEGNPFQGRVDLQNIALIGHSRGGEAVCHAALFNRLKHHPDNAMVRFDFGFDIRSVVAIAPSDGQYRPGDRMCSMRDVNFLVLQGGHDADVSSFVGSRLYHRLRFSKDRDDLFKASLFIPRANHGQFNTVWGVADSPPPRSWFVNRAALLPGEDQRRIGRVYVAAFLETTLRGRLEYLPLLRNPRAGRGWLPDALLIQRFEDGSFDVVADFEEDIDVSTTRDGGKITAQGLESWREGDIKIRSGSRRGDRGVFLGWKHPDPKTDEKPTSQAVEAAVSRKDHARPTYTISFAKPKSVETSHALVLNVAARPKKGRDNAPVELSVELVDEDGNSARLPIGHAGALLPALRSRFTITPYTEGRYKKHEPNLQTFELPIRAFLARNEALDAKRLRRIKLVFDRSAAGEVILDRIGFTRR